MAVQDQAEQDTSYVVKETNALRKDFLGLEKRVLIERYPPLEKALQVVQRSLGELTSKINSLDVKYKNQQVDDPQQAQGNVVKHLSARVDRMDKEHFAPVYKISELGQEIRGIQQLLSQESQNRMRLEHEFNTFKLQGNISSSLSLPTIVRTQPTLPGAGLEPNYEKA